jgi:hypothetical protein
MSKKRLSGVAAEQRLILDYNKAKDRFEKLSKQLDDMFMAKLHEALEANNGLLAQSILRSCPDSVTKAFMMDAIRQHDKGLTQ